MQGQGCNCFTWNPCAPPTGPMMFHVEQEVLDRHVNVSRETEPKDLTKG